MQRVWARCTLSGLWFFLDWVIYPFWNWILAPWLNWMVSPFFGSSSEEIPIEEAEPATELLVDEF